MQKYFYSESVKSQLEAKFGANSSIVGKSTHRFPESAEREYIRAVNQYMKAVKLVIEKEMPGLKEEYRRQLNELNELNELNDEIRMDGIFDLHAFITDFFDRINEKLSTMGATQRLLTQLFKIGAITKKTEISEWRRMVRKTLNVDLSKDYYNGDFFEEELRQWVSDNVDLIKTVPNDMLGKMKETIEYGYSKGLSASDIGSLIQQNYSMSKRHAKFIARDQMAKLSANITRKEHEDAGVSRYKWSTSDDERVRPGHSILDGKIFEYNNPPEIMEWRQNKYGGYWVNTGRRCNPGEDFNCRCVGIPVFDKDTLNLPLEDDDRSK